MNSPCPNPPVDHQPSTINGNSKPPTPIARFHLNPLGLLIFAAWAVPSVAFAYPGEALLQFGAQYIIAPLGIFAVVIALAASFFNPRMVAGAVFAAILCCILYFVIHMAGNLTSVFQS